MGALVAARRLALAVRGLGVVSGRPRGARGAASMVFINHRASATKRRAALCARARRRRCNWSASECVGEPMRGCDGSGARADLLGALARMVRRPYAPPATPWPLAAPRVGMAACLPTCVSARC